MFWSNLNGKFQSLSIGQIANEVEPNNMIISNYEY